MLRWLERKNKNREHGRVTMGCSSRVQGPTLRTLHHPSIV
jgi:hypothetical protein